MKIRYQMTINGEDKTHTVSVRPDPSNNLYYATIQDFGLSQRVGRHYGTNQNHGGR